MEYHHASNDYWEAKGLDSTINSEILRRLADDGIELAFPTRTIEMKDDAPEAAATADAVAPA